jgi:16S rRNA (guanine966-N2)-methyltransferase
MGRRLDPAVGAAQLMAGSELRIVGGRLKGRRLTTPNGPDVRPTSARAREALFNRLNNGGYGLDGASALTGARVADLCCGTGALAFEALSQGASAASLVEKDPQTLNLARRNAEALGVAAECRFVVAYLPSGLARALGGETFDLVFIDPPYAQPIAAELLSGLLGHGLLAPGALVSVEISAKASLELPTGYKLLNERKYGAAKLLLLTPDLYPMPAIAGVAGF